MLKLVLLSFIILPITGLAATSQENRANKNVEFTLQSGIDYRMGTGQVGAMFFLDPNNLVGLKVGDSSYENEQQTNFSLQYKHYTGNSFYVAGEIFYLNTREEINGFWNDVFNIQREYARYSSLGAGIRIGNQWTWQNFTLGCDWVGVGKRFGTFRKDTDKLYDETVTLLHVIIGASF